MICWSTTITPTARTETKSYKKNLKIQWPKEKLQKNKQRYTIHTHKAKVIYDCGEP